MSFGSRSAFIFAFLVSAQAGCGGPPPVPADAGDDGATIDAASPCTTDLACDDGLFCTGTERCVLGACAPGAVVRCDDGIECTADVCSEDVRACVSRVPDADHDGAGDVRCVDSTGTPLGTDCDDDDADRFAGNVERCDAAMHDEDCDDTTHGGNDLDADGFEDARCCNGAACGDDCDDLRAGAHPGATEACNLVDDDCNGAVDEGVAVSGFVDADRDGYGDATRPISACGTASDFSPYGTDCDDADVARNPGQAEFCDGADNDCNGAVDEGASNVDWYVDADGDGFGSAASGAVSACSPQPGHSLLDRDCDDGAPAISPAAAELCDGIDDDCNGLDDFVISVGDLEDDDADDVADAACGAPRGLDCDDRDAASGPAEAESCDGRDNDCDARVDEGATSVAFFRDADGDGFGTDAMLVVACSPPPGYSRRGGDCDDASVAVRPGSSEACNAIDEDCDGAVDEAEASLTCSIAHATSVCVSGSCQIALCDPGFADCSVAEGCDTDVTSDPAHCGSCAECGEVGSSCTSGSCTPTLESLAIVGSASTSDELVRDVAVVPGTNDVIVVGAFRGTLTFGATVLTSLGGLDGFAARLRPNGSAVWAARWGGALDDEMTSIGIEPISGALALGGNLCGPQSVCGGPIGSGTLCLGFFQRFPSVGAPGCNYATIMDAAGGMDLRSLAMERTGGQTYVYAAGSLRGASSALGVASTIDADGFVARFREATGAVREWTRMATEIYVDSVNDIALDGAGHVVAIGTAGGAIDFGLGPGSFSGYSDPFVMSLTSTTGVPIGGRMFGANGASYDVGEAILVDAGTVYVAGTFGDPSGPSTLFAGGTVTVASNGGRDGYVVGLDAATLAARFAVAVGGSQDDEVHGLALVSGGVVATGSFRGALPVRSGSFTADLGTDAVAVAFGSTGALLWARHARGPFDETSAGAALLADGHVAWVTNFSTDLAILGTSLTSPVGTGVAMARLAF